MATISAATSESIAKITKWLGLNENPDGDTKLKLGEATECRNWRITRDYNLQRRPGQKTMFTLGSAPVRGMWHGAIDGAEYFLAACDGHMWSVWDASANDFYDDPVDLGELDTDSRVNFFPFQGKVYILNGKEYYEYDGFSFHQVLGYRPLISVSNVPSGGGDMLEEVNKLNGARRLWFSPDGKNNVFKLPETDLISLDYVRWTSDLSDIPDTLYTVDLMEGTVTFGSASAITFAGDGSTTVFYAPDDNVSIVSVTVDGEEFIPDYTFDKYDTIEFTDPIPANSTVGVTESFYSIGIENFGGDGSSKEFTLTYNSSIKEITEVTINLAATTDYTYDSADGKITFATAPTNLASIAVHESLVTTKTESFTPEEETSKFTLTNFAPDERVGTVDDVEKSANKGYEYRSDDKSITFDTAPASGAVIKVEETIVPPRGTNSIEIGYSVGAIYRNDVVKNTNFELFSGSTDTRVFLYGNGTYNALYSSIDYDGQPRADYFPDLNVVGVGDENTPITGMIRHGSSLLAYKSDSAWAITFGTITLDDGNTEAGFYVKPINRSFGNAALGQVQLVLNTPRTLFNNDIYEWKNSSYYTSALSLDEKQARRISDRIYATLEDFDIANCYVYDDNANNEYYICDSASNTALVNNYAADVWYKYTGWDCYSACEFDEVLYIGSSDGKFKKVDYAVKSDDGENINAYWESGSIDFGKPWMRKLINVIWIGIKPEAQGQVTVTVQTDKKSEYAEKVVTSDLSTFASMDFSRFSFAVNRKPQIKKLKIKAKKFVFYKLIFESDSNNSSATILNADMRVRMTGYAK